MWHGESVRVGCRCRLNEQQLARPCPDDALQTAAGYVRKLEMAPVSAPSSKLPVRQEAKTDLGYGHVDHLQSTISIVACLNILELAGMFGWENHHRTPQLAGQVTQASAVFACYLAREIGSEETF